MIIPYIMQKPFLSLTYYNTRYMMRSNRISFINYEALERNLHLFNTNKLDSMFIEENRLVNKDFLNREVKVLTFNAKNIKHYAIYKNLKDTETFINEEYRNLILSFTSKPTVDVEINKEILKIDTQQLSPTKNLSTAVKNLSNIDSEKISKLQYAIWSIIDKDQIITLETLPEDPIVKDGLPSDNLRDHIFSKNGIGTYNDVNNLFNENYLINLVDILNKIHMEKCLYIIEQLPKSLKSTSINLNLSEEELEDKFVELSDIYGKTNIDLLVKEPIKIYKETCDIIGEANVGSFLNFIIEDIEKTTVFKLIDAENRVKERKFKELKDFIIDDIDNGGDGSDF